MKKLSISLLVMLLIASLFTSCIMGSDDASDVRVKVKITPAGGGRSLTTDIETINLDDNSITWHYSATKVSETQFNYGATSDSLLPKDGIVTLSQGDWSIGLWGIKDGKKVYAGNTSNVTIKWNFYEPNVTVPITVKQNTGDYGYIVLTDVKIPVNDELKTPNFASIDSTIIMNFNGVNMRLECIPGPHTVTFEYRSDNGDVLSSKSLVVEVISGRETTISGNIDKSEITSGSSSLTEVKQAIEVKKEGDTVVNVLVAPANTSSYLNQTTVTFPQGALHEEATTAELNLSVKSAGSEFSVTSSSSSAPVAGIDISLKVNEQEVTSFNNEYVVITTYILAGLESVQVKYNGTDGGQPIATDNDNAPDKTVAAELTSSSSATALGYNKETGLLRFKTNHFSEYYVLAECKAVNTIKNVGYKSFVDAIANASEGDTILLKKDITSDDTVIITKGININLNGYNITGDNFRTLQFVEGISTISGKGTISSTVDNVGSSVIRVGDNNATSDVSLSIGNDVTISTSTAYGITVFGSKSESLEVYGKIISSAPFNNSYDGCAIATVGTDSTTATITINEGADVSAENTNAIYMPSGVLNVLGGSISGMTGIYIKSANATISGGTITGIGDKKEYSYYGNGGISTGDALVVDSCGYPNGNPSVRVTGGVFISEKAKSVGSYKYNNNPLITGFIEGGQFSSDPEYKAIGYKSEENNGIFEVLVCSDHKKVDGICEYCGKDLLFEYGNGTESDPYLIYDEIQFKNIYKKGSGKFYKLMEDITVGNNYTDSNNYFKFASPYLIDSEFDGNGYTITVTEDASLFYIVQNSTIKNLNVVLDYTMVVYAQGEEVLFDNVDVSGEFSVSGNESAYVIYGFIDNKLSFKDCTSSAEMNGTAYNAVFVGYVNWNKYDSNTLEFINCENKGTLACSYASMFLANPNAYNINMVVTNCKNSGKIQATATNQVFNYYYAVTSNCYSTFVINGVVYNDIADGRSSAPTCFEDTTVINTGTILQGPINTGMSISQNSDRTFTITDAIIEGKTVDHYTVYVGVYATLIEGGSSRNYATETINASSETRVTSLKNLNFIDTEWVNNNVNAVEGELAGNVIYTLDGESYYMLKTPNTDTLHGNPKAPQMIYVVAYDNTNKPLASVKLTGNI